MKGTSVRTLVALSAAMVLLVGACGGQPATTGGREYGHGPVSQKVGRRWFAGSGRSGEPSRARASRKGRYTDDTDGTDADGSDQERQAEPAS